MSFDRTSTLINPPTVVSYKPQSRIGLITGVIILAVVVIILIILLIILLISRSRTKKVECNATTDCGSGLVCSKNFCVTCTAPPNVPTNVSSTYNVLTGTATITWAPMAGAKSYNIYRQLEDPSVGVNNNAQKTNTVGTSQAYSGLSEGTHYFVVTSVNDCGESQPSTPVVLAPSCSSLPATMAAPTVVPLLNDCAGATTSQQVTVAFPDMSIPNGVYVIQGTGQAGNVSPYLYLVSGNSYGPAGTIYLKCGSNASDHFVTQITETENATLTVTAPPVAGTNFTMSWIPIAGMERYVVFLVGVSGSGVAHYYGGFAEANESSLTLQTNLGDSLVFGMVLGYRICNRSAESAHTAHISPA